MTPTPSRLQGTPAEKLREVLARLPVGHSLIPSKIFNLFVLDKDGHNKGYVTESGEVRWWAVGGGELHE